jgi:4-hydroxybenzoate polyprenyltransferase
VRRAVDFRSVACCLIEARPAVQAVFLMRYLAGAVLADPGHSPPAGRTALGTAGWSCSTAAVYVFNGLSDRKEDIGNGSTRPIAAGRLSFRFAAIAVCLLAVVGVGCAWSLGVAEGLAATLFLLIGYAYSGPPFPLKRTYLTAALGGGAGGLVTYVGGGVATGGHGMNTTLAFFAGAMSLWMGGVGGIAKDLSDVEGDRIAGRRTLPIAVGEVRARRLLVVAVALVAVGFSAVAALWADRLIRCADTVLVGALAICAVCVVMNTSAETHPEAHRSRSRRRLPYRVFMVTQYAVHVTLAVTIFLPSH